jgi:hypothetical protein
LRLSSVQPHPLSLSNIACNEDTPQVCPFVNPIRICSAYIAFGISYINNIISLWAHLQYIFVTILWKFTRSIQPLHIHHPARTPPRGLPHPRSAERTRLHSPAYISTRARAVWLPSPLYDLMITMVLCVLGADICMCIYAIDICACMWIIDIVRYYFGGYEI